MIKMRKKAYKHIKDIKQISDKQIYYKNLNSVQKRQYHQLHRYIRENKPKPDFCQRCGIKNPVNIANRSGKYKKDIRDYLWVCRKCHHEMDGLVKNFKQAYKWLPRNKYGRFGKSNKPIIMINCYHCKKLIEKQNPKQKYCYYHCKKLIEKQNPKQKYCYNCRVKFDIGHKKYYGN
jgi:hypothetical protein